jgi:hypothetical protein
MKETIDLTPAWSAVLPMMLELYTQLNEIPDRTKEQKEALAGLRGEFKNMARAADEYNEIVKKEKAA